MVHLRIYRRGISESWNYAIAIIAGIVAVSATAPSPAKIDDETRCRPWQAGRIRTDELWRWFWIRREGTMAEKVALSKKMPVKAFWKWTFFTFQLYYERLPGQRCLQSMSHLPEKLYPDSPEEQKNLWERHMAFYNTEPHFGHCQRYGHQLWKKRACNGVEITDDAINSVDQFDGALGRVEIRWQEHWHQFCWLWGLYRIRRNVMGAVAFSQPDGCDHASIAYFVCTWGDIKQERPEWSDLERRKRWNGDLNGVHHRYDCSWFPWQQKLCQCHAIWRSKVGATKLAAWADVLDKLLLKGMLPLESHYWHLYLLRSKKMKSNNRYADPCSIGGSVETYWDLRIGEKENGWDNEDLAAVFGDIRQVNWRYVRNQASK